jgi:hypothetical protein
LCIVGICELRAMPLDKANRPAVRDKCTILASAYIGDWAPSRVDIGREAEDTILKQVGSSLVSSTRRVTSARQALSCLPRTCTLTMVAA